jgi:sec-independent protein translocase protein TatB
LSGARYANSGFSGTILFVGLTFEKLLVIMLIAVFVVGPDRLPSYAQKLAQLVKSLKQMATGAKDRMRDEMGPEFDDVDWKKLDPRQYDPRRIIRDALLEDENSPEVRRERAAQASAARQAQRDASSSGVAAGAAVSTDAAAPASVTPTFDEEAT